MEKILNLIEKICTQYQLDHRIVGSCSYTGWLDYNTTWKINIASKTVTLLNHKKINSQRSDQTLRDIDIIVLKDNPHQLRQLKQQLASITSCPISIEPITKLNHQSFFPQFNTAIRYNQSNDFFLSIDNHHIPISRKSLDAWKLQTSNCLITVRHPYADYLAYHFRSISGLKPKDKNKLQFLKQLADEVISPELSQGIDYQTQYSSWLKYIDTLNHPTGKTLIKARLAKLYWSTIGSNLAHGNVPLIGKYLIKLSDKFHG